MDLGTARVAVTGGAGFIGSHVVDALLEDGTEVLVIDDLSTGSAGNLSAHAGSPGLRLEVADVRDAKALHRLLRGVDLVLHMAVVSVRASLSDPHRVLDVNATGTLNVCRAALASDVRRVVYVSSSEAYGSASYAPMDECHPLEPTTVYGASKAAGEMVALAHWHTYGMESVVVRPFNTYGPREHCEGTSAEVIPKFVLRGLAGRPPVVFGSGAQTRDFTWVGDTARGILAAAASAELVGGAVNIAHGEEITLLDLAARVLKALGREDLDVVHEQERPGDVMRHYADTRKAETVLGFRAEIGLADGLERYVEWVRSSGIDVDAWAARERVRNW